MVSSQTRSRRQPRTTASPEAYQQQTGRTTPVGYLSAAALATVAGTVMEVAVGMLSAVRVWMAPVSL